MDAVARANGLRTIFEPLHPLAIPRARPYCNRRIPPDVDLPDLKAYLQEIRDGRFHSLWSDYRINIGELIIRPHDVRSYDAFKRWFRRCVKAKRNYQSFRKSVKNDRVITKFIRANLMLSWVRHNLDARIILFIRHPGAVVESRLRLGGSEWHPQDLIQDYRNDVALRESGGDRYGYLLEGRRLTRAEALTLIWCIENQIPLEESVDHKFVVVFYERLVANPMNEWKRITIGLELENLPGDALIRQASQQASSGWKSDQPSSQILARWRERLDSSTKAEIDGILRETGMTTYSVSDLYPHV